MDSIGKEIKEIVRKKGISFYRIAKDLGIAQESLYRSLLNDANPRWKRIKQILDYLDCDLFIKHKKKGGEVGHRGKITSRKGRKGD